MKKIVAGISGILVALTAFVNTPAAAEEPPADPGASEVIGFVVTRSDDAAQDVTIEQANETASQFDREITEATDPTAAAETVVQLNEALPATEANELLTELEQTEGIELVEPVARATASMTPTDTWYHQQWQFHDTAAGMKMPAVWDLGLGAGSTVAVVDTGSTVHPDITWTGGYDFISAMVDSHDGDERDGDPNEPGVVNEAGCAYPSVWHGTHVGGLIGAEHNGIGVAGIAPEATLVPIRVLGPCGGSTWDVAEAVIWASGGFVEGVPTNPNPANVINLSLGASFIDGVGAPYCPSYMQYAVDVARANGAVIVAASGNSGREQLEESPAICDGVIAVGGSNRDGGVWYGSDIGSRLNVVAPGQYVYTTVNRGYPLPGDATYGFQTGTSFASPEVAGAIALLLARETNLSGADNSVQDRLSRSGRPIAGCVGCGAGLLDATLLLSKFRDVPVGDVFFHDVDWLVTQGITTGYYPGHYGRNDPVLREQMAVFLWRAAGSPAVNTTGCHTFTDVQPGTVFATAICWAKQQGITQGYTRTLYGYGKPVLRGEMAAFIYRAAGSPAVNLTSCHTFTDIPADSPFQNAICWLKQQGITQGYTPTIYGYNNTVLRGEMAAFLHRWKT